MKRGIIPLGDRPEYRRLSPAAREATRRLRQAKPADEPEKISPVRIAAMAIFVLVLFYALAVTGPIFFAAMNA